MSSSTASWYVCNHTHTHRHTEFPLLSSLTIPIFLQLFDLIYREETLFNVIKSVTRNGRSILLTALLALILVYLFSIVGFLFLKEDFIMEVDPLAQIAAGNINIILEIWQQNHGMRWRSWV